MPVTSGILLPPSPGRILRAAVPRAFSIYWIPGLFRAGGVKCNPSSRGRCAGDGCGKSNWLSDINRGSAPPGSAAAYKLTFTPEGGYKGTLDLSCAGLPSEASCSFKPATLSFTTSASQTSTLSISTTAPTLALARPPSSGQPLRTPLALAGLIGLLFGASRMRRLGTRLRLIAALFFLALVPALATGCGGGSSGGGGGGGNAGTPAGTYTVTVHAVDSANNLDHTLTVTLVVQ